jgi:hypothetical protein
MRWLAAETLVSEGVIDTTHLDPPPTLEPLQLSDMLTTSDVNEVIVTLAETPSQSNATESPSTKTRPFQVTKLLLAGAIAASEIVASTEARKSRVRAGAIANILTLNAKNAYCNCPTRALFDDAGGFQREREMVGQQGSRVQQFLSAIPQSGNIIENRYH